MIKEKVYVLGHKGRIGSAMIREGTIEGYDTMGMDIGYGWDFTKSESWSRLWQLVDRPWGLVNCTYPKDFMDHIEIAYNTILYGSMIGFRRIVNISSIYGMRGQNPNLYKGSKISPASLMYNAVKAAVIGMTKGAVVYAPNCIVNCVSSGGISDENMDQAFVSNYCKRTPAMRLANGEDVANAAMFLMRKESEYIVGQNIVVDGGFTAW
jgi:NAD(P)-dependent dehydrogenase (short-subunit alcohol dehydrogenase family)